jgi:hypothetical protein
VVLLFESENFFEPENIRRIGRLAEVLGAEPLSCLPIPEHCPYILIGCIDNLEFEVKPKGMDIQLESFYSYPG